jgi:spermidine synthase
VKQARVRVQESRYGRELIVDETFASFYRPDSPTTGSVWDAIAAPLLALPASRLRSLLLLGLGGGSVARIARAIAPAAHIVGVELDPEVVAVAREHFDIDALDIELVVGDALDFLRHEQRRFDAVLEDVFIGHGDDVHKPAWIPEPGHSLAAARLQPGGLLVSNTLDEVHDTLRAMRGRFPAIVRIGVEGYDNQIVVGGPERLDARALRAAVRASPVLAESVGALRFRTDRRSRDLMRTSG